jgi:peptidoglycan/LPS O-acetylase OafA/YrhL
MRAVAVAVVLLYHAHFGFSGGFVGVDVFFVLSGFLITRLLHRERQNTSQIRIREFYARRVRRILPAATLVLLTTILLSHQLLSPVRAHQTAIDAGWASGFVANFHFASVGADYLQATRQPSLLQHWWSLAVEEQFYLVWPSLLALTWKLTRRSARSGVIVCLAIALPSFWVGLQLTRHNPSWGYFATWSRGWELAAGALCAFIWTSRDRLPLRGAAGWIGLAAIGYAVFRFDATTSFPGFAALAPVVGTSLVIISIGATRSPGRLLSLKPLQWVGGRSYGIYLWHWPALIILFDRIDRPSVVWRAGILAAAVVAAALSFWLLENPVRHLPALVRSAGRSIAIGAVLVAMVLAGATVLSRATADIAFSTGFTATVPTTPTASLAPTTVTTIPASSVSTATVSTADTTLTTAAPTTAPVTAAPPSWNDLLTAKLTSELQPLIAASATQELLPDNITPTISAQSNDHPTIYSTCLLTFTQTTSPDCEFGDPAATTTIALIGDSHAVQWFPALEAAANTNHWKLIVLTKRACPTASVSVMLGASTPYGACDQWRTRALARIAASDVDLVVITSWRKGYKGNAGGNPVSIGDGQWREGLTKSVTPMLAAGKKVLLLGDTPQARQHMNDCMSNHPRNMTRCNLVHDKAVDLGQDRLEADLAASLGIAHYDTSDWFCAGGVCPAVIGNLAVYLDTNHINNTYGLYLAPYMDLLVRSTLDLPRS